MGSSVHAETVFSSQEADIARVQWFKPELAV
jgi:hypothetical protein